MEGLPHLYKKCHLLLISDSHLGIDPKFLNNKENPEIEAYNVLMKKTA